MINPLPTYPPPSAFPRVAVFLMNAYTTHGDILRGILDYARGHTPWGLDLKTGRRDEPSISSLDWSTCDAAIVNSVTPALLDAIRQRNLPVVLVSSAPVSDFQGCVLHCDNEPIARTAAEYLLAKRCAAYAFVDVPGMPWAAARGRRFAALVGETGGKCLTVKPDRRLARQLASVPRPLGVFAADDVRARETLDACRAAGLSVPEEVAILGVDNDETLCELSSPTLSSIPLTTRAASFRAAEILDQVLCGKIGAAEMPDAIYTGTAVVERQSTARSYEQDALVRDCRALIAERFTSPLRVADLAHALYVSRRTLETRFRALTGTTVGAEILRFRLNRARKLLATTDRSQERIAVDCGFCDASHLGAAFRKHLKSRPSVFRMK